MSDQQDNIRTLEELILTPYRSRNVDIQVRPTPNGEDVLTSFEDLINYPYMVFNGRHGNHWLVVKFPSGIDPNTHCKERRVPLPTIFVMDKNQADIWGLWKLKDPIPKENLPGNNYFDAMRRRLRRHIRPFAGEEITDKDVGPNQFHQQWDVDYGSQDYTLNEIKQELLGERKMNEAIHLEYLKAINKGVEEMMEAAFREKDVPFDELDRIGFNEGRAVISTHAMSADIYIPHVRKAVQEQLKRLRSIDRSDYIEEFSQRQRERAKKKGALTRNKKLNAVLATYDEVQSVRKTAQLHNLPKSTVSDWIKRR